MNATTIQEQTRLPKDYKSAIPVRWVPGMRRLRDPIVPASGDGRTEHRAARDGGHLGDWLLVEAPLLT